MLCLVQKYVSSAYEATSGLSFPSLSLECKCRALDIRTSPPKRLVALTRGSFSATGENTRLSSSMCEGTT